MADQAIHNSDSVLDSPHPLAMDLLLCFALYCNQHGGKQGREVTSLSFTNPTFTILNPPAHSASHPHSAMAWTWCLHNVMVFNRPELLLMVSSKNLFLFYFTQCPGVMLPILTCLLSASHNGFDKTADGHADQFWSPGPDYVTFQFFCPAISATSDETSGEQRILLIKVDRRNGWLVDPYPELQLNQQL